MTYRSRSNSWTLAGLGVFYALLAAPQFHTSAGWMVLAAAIVSTCWWLAFWLAVQTDELGVTIRNPPWRRRRIAWEDIRGFRLGAHGRIFSHVCLVDLNDGTTAVALGIAVPRVNYARVGRTREARFVEALNERLPSGTRYPSLSGA